MGARVLSKQGQKQQRNSSFISFFSAAASWEKYINLSECNLPTTQKILSDGRPTNLPCITKFEKQQGQVSKGNGAPSALLVVTIKARYAPLSIRGNFQWQHWLWLYAVDAKPTSNAVPFANLFISPPLSVLQAKPLRQLPCWCQVILGKIFWKLV